MKRIKRSLLLSALALFGLALSVPVQAVKVDIYVAMESGTSGAVLTPDIMKTSTHGGIAQLPVPDWLLISGNCGRSGCTGCTSRNMWVSTDNVRPLPGKVTVDGQDYTGLGMHTWMFSDLYKWNFVDIRYGSDRTSLHPPPRHRRKTVACFYTPNPDQFYGYGCTFDTIIIPVYNSYAVLQTIGETTDGHSYPKTIFLRAHGSKIVNGAWVGTVSNTCIRVTPGKTYWVNLHYDGPAGVCKVAVFDPDNKYAQVGAISESECNPWDGNGAESRVAFGRADHHSDLDKWWTETFSYFSHIMIDYTEGKFPLLPDITGLYLSSPKKDVTWVRGFSHDITWTSGGVTASEPVKIELRNSGVTTLLTEDVLVESGTSTWQIPEDQMTGSYTIKITAGVYTDTSETFTIAAPAAPIVQTLPAQSVTTNSASLLGTVNPMSSGTTYYFEYGLTTEYGSGTSGVTLAAGDVEMTVQAQVSNLKAGTTYHFQLKATNSAGTTNGTDMTFTTSGGGGGGGGDSGGGGGGGCFITTVQDLSLWLMVLGLVAGWVVWTIRRAKG